jgi:hypothetical protein
VKSYPIIISLLLITGGCSSNEIDELAEEVIKKKSGIDIRLTPIPPGVDGKF